MHGYNNSMEYSDLLHALWMGTGRDSVASHIMLLAEWWPPVQTLESWDARLQYIHQDFQSWCREKKMRPSTIDDISDFAGILSA